ncbi:hypothetical protein H3Z85_21195 [Chryseobacterium indologenes]|uniref:Uncharacterized protein n=1 Tax=Chryseobacterium indologenes TaxID=253 RepID=A0A1Z3W1C0_CHRID|nr:MULTISPECIES: hypothetical protein [Chryseobacterium]ASE61553.1 hypothetical protein CEQ15_08640 [Chryseobacterium indologenes]ATN05639.1 hypothetical protein CRN76_09610 [Chryseobacterium indologenes]AYY85604.1 hypothetical protein EGX91_14130 [Chryseobacterium indologenes]AYZ35372.1 hypothetical protein EGY07_07210 [Chryseobacterium indologenes]AZB17289.1 hypothetical protein EG352_05650 [Chryseobacterium indologenes]
MDNIETDLVDPVRDKNIIDEYFRLTVKKELNLDINLSDEYVIAQNIVSKKLILVKTFSEVIIMNPDLYFLMQSLIHKINTGLLSKNQVTKTLELLKDGE